MTTGRSTVPRVSIGLPVYNGERYLGAALDTLLAQTWRDFELVISDNASTDGTADICQRYVGSDERIRYVRAPNNLGGAWNFNRVFHLSTAPYFMWAAHDDMWRPEYVSSCVEVLDRSPDIAHCYTGACIVDSEGEYVRDRRHGPDLTCDSPAERFHRFLLSPTVFHAFFGLFRASVLKRTRLMVNFEAADVFLLGHIAILGKSYEYPASLFLNRDHRERGTYMHGVDLASKAAVAEWYDTSNRGKVPVPMLKGLAHYLRAIHSSDTPLLDRLRCYYLVLRWTNWHRDRLAKELWLNATKVVGKLG